METITNMKTFDDMILSALRSYVKGRADEIVERHKISAGVEIESAIREEVTRTVLSLGRMVSVENHRNELRITIHDKKKEAAG